MEEESNGVCEIQDQKSTEREAERLEAIAVCGDETLAFAE